MFRALTVLGFWCLFISPLISQPLPAERQRLIPTGTVLEDQVGGAVSVSGDVAIVGAVGVGGNFSGAAVIYRRSGTVWQEEQRLEPNPVLPLQLFGATVAIQGDVAMVGAPLFDVTPNGNDGIVFVYRYDGSTWVEEQVLTSPVPGGSTFGRRVKLAGDCAVIGQGGYTNAAGILTGGAHVFRYSAPSWVAEATLVPAAAVAGDSYGFEVAVSGDRVLLGAPGVDSGGVQVSGAATFFRFDGAAGWIEEQTVALSTPTSGNFGHSVSLDGDVAVVGAFEATTPVGPRSGSVSVFRLTAGTWIEEAVLVAPGLVVQSWFGSATALLDNDLFIGAPNQGFNGTGGPGATYRYQFDGSEWNLLGAIVPANSLLNDDTGASIAYDGETLLIGAPRDDTGFGLDSGSATIFEVRRFRRGDVNNDGLLDLADPIQLLDILFGVSNAFLCENAADANDDELVDLADATRLLSWLFTFAVPPPPAPICGEDPTLGPLGCEVTVSCP